ncbi:hypothetical protein [Chryseobacterium camelliae]|uniref:hypothetical protein n=1 Tax=Chryseobacterium camelliae TaxID=1265445 RepID=UPI000C1C85D4|nr:hypothetical protein [Chryseobacterium camelliae]
MKNIITLFILTVGISKINAQLDTLNYLKQFEFNKANYIGQPFSKLLNEMTQIQPKTAWAASMGRKKTISADTRFKFAEKELSFRRTVTLLIKWQDPIPRDQTQFYEQKNAFYFTNEEKTFYGSKIVKDIIVYR